MTPAAAVTPGQPGDAACHPSTHLRGRAPSGTAPACPGRACCHRGSTAWRGRAPSRRGSPAGAAGWSPRGAGRRSPAGWGPGWAMPRPSRTHLELAEPVLPWVACAHVLLGGPTAAASAQRGAAPLRSPARAPRPPWGPAPSSGSGHRAAAGLGVMDPNGGEGQGTAMSHMRPHPAGDAPQDGGGGVCPPPVLPSEIRLKFGRGAAWCRGPAGTRAGAVAEPCRAAGFGCHVGFGCWGCVGERGTPRGSHAAPSPTHRKHLRVRRATPSPQELEQELQGPQGPQAPRAGCRRGRAGAGGSGTHTGVPRAGS